MTADTITITLNNAVGQGTLTAALAATAFDLFRVGRCPCCGQITTFDEPVAVATGMPPALAHLVPQVTKCHANGCTSSVQSIKSLERRW